MKHSMTYPVTIAIALAVVVAACKHEKQAEGIDKLLLDMARETGGFSWFKHSDALLDASSGTGHSEPFLRTRYNEEAATVLNSDGRITEGAVFPEGALVVKELYHNGSDLGRYAIMYKKPSDANADAAGWVWGYVNADGTVATAASEKGSGCRGCHSQANHIDLNLMNIYFP